MREIQRGDLVLHILKGWEPGLKRKRYLCGFSYAADDCQTLHYEPPDAGAWAEFDSYYFVPLRGHAWFVRPIPTTDFIAGYEEQLRSHIELDRPQRFPFQILRTNGRITVPQGLYLQQATPHLMRLIREAVGIQLEGEPSGRRGTPLREFAEGQVRTAEAKYFTRHPELSRAAKAHHRYRCQGCGLRMDQLYGAIGKDYLECHHLTAFCDRQQPPPTALSTINDVTVLCPNCHRMIHRRRPAYSLTQLRQRIGRSKAVRRGLPWKTPGGKER